MLFDYLVLMLQVPFYVFFGGTICSIQARHFSLYLPRLGSSGKPAVVVLVFQSCFAAFARLLFIA